MFSKVIQLVRSEGLFSVLKKILTKVTSQCLYERTDVLYLCIDTLPRLKATDLDIYTCDLNEFKAWATQHERLAQQLPLAEARFQSGHRCYIGKMPDGRLGHIIWSTQGDSLYASCETGEKCRKDLSRQVGIVIDAWTPDYARGLNYYPLVMSKAMFDLVEQYGEAWAWVLTTNKPSINGFMKTGFKPRFVMGRTRYLGFYERCHENDATGF
ncbi:MAG: hypothetical protein ACPGF7_04745 [Pontibacterium sp.]